MWILGHFVAISSICKTSFNQMAWFTVWTLTGAGLGVATELISKLDR